MGIGWLHFTLSRQEIMERPVYLGSKESSNGDTQWAIRLGDEIWTEVSKEEGTNRGKTIINGGVRGGWFMGWGAKAQGPLHRGPTALSGAGVPPEENILGYTNKTDKDVEMFNADYLKKNCSYTEETCNDYTYQILGWLLGQSFLLETLLSFPKREEDHEIEVFEQIEEEDVDDGRLDPNEIFKKVESYSDESDDGEGNSEDDYDSEEEDPTYMPSHKRCNEYESEDESSNLKRKVFSEEVAEGIKRKKRRSSLEFESDESETDESQLRTKTNHTGSYANLEKENEIDSLNKSSSFEENSEESEEDESHLKTEKSRKYLAHIEEENGTEIENEHHRDEALLSLYKSSMTKNDAKNIRSGTHEENCTVRFGEISNNADSNEYNPHEHSIEL